RAANRAVAVVQEAQGRKAGTPEPRALAPGAEARAVSDHRRDTRGRARRRQPQEAAHAFTTQVERRLVLGRALGGLLHASLDGIRLHGSLLLAAPVQTKGHAKRARRQRPTT